MILIIHLAVIIWLCCIFVTFISTYGDAVNVKSKVKVALPVYFACNNAKCPIYKVEKLGWSDS